MRVIRKVSFFILAVLPLFPLIALCFSLYRSGNFSDISQAMTYLSEFLTFDQVSTLGTAMSQWLTSMSSIIGVGGDCIALAVTYIVYLIFLELTYMILDVLLWIPRKLSYIIEMRS